MPVFRAWQEAFDRLGVPLTLEEWAATIGTADHRDPIDVLRERAPEPFDEDAVQRVRRARRDELLDAEDVRPGVERWLRDARELGLPVAIASSSPADWVTRHLRTIGLHERFDHIACYDSTCPSKPAPDLYLRACAGLGVDPREAVALEDAPNGVIAAKAAGLACIAVPNELTRLLPLDAADLVVDSLADLALRDALVKLGCSPVA